MTQAATTKELPKNVDSTPKYIPLTKIIAKLKKTGSVSDTAKILKVSNNAIYKRLKAAGINKEDFVDYTTDKALAHEIMQYRIARGLSAADIKKMQGGSKVLAICQLDDKIRAHRGEGDTKNSISVILNMACQANEKTVEVKAQIVDNSTGKTVDK